MGVRVLDAIQLSAVSVLLTTMSVVFVSLLFNLVGCGHTIQPVTAPSASSFFSLTVYKVCFLNRYTCLNCLIITSQPFL